MFSGSNTSATTGFEVLAEILAAPPAGQWSELAFANRKPYRWIRYEGPRGSYGRVSKIEFYAGSQRLAGPVIAPFMSSKWASVVTDRPNAGVAGLSPDGQYVGIDIGEKASCRRPTIRPGGGEFSQAVAVTMHCATPGAAIRYTTDGTPPTREHGQTYSAPLSIDKTTTLRAVALCAGQAPSPDADAVLLLPPIGRRTTLHLGNSLTGNAVGRFALHARTAGVVHDTKAFLMGGGLARTLWNTAMLGPGDPADHERWQDLFTTTHSMGGVVTYPVAQVEKSAADWKKLWPSLAAVSDVTFQPRDADIAEEADYTLRWLKLVRERFPQVQPWLYVEWTEME
ncbi:MAG TPA: chitobiase/beta-hexosaminidase C-terminal domain-containing protein, partial [Pirellulales bacterium]